MTIKFKLLLPIFLQIFLCCLELTAQQEYDAYYRGNSSDSFLTSRVLKSKIDVSEFQVQLLDAAIFHFTNLERGKEKLQAFKFNDNLYKSSVLHSERMIVEDFFSHENRKQRKWRTPKDRMFFYDDSYRTVGENILENFLLDYEGKTLRYRTEYNDDGDLIYLNSDGLIINYASYFKLAERLVLQWMNSPPHRANILNAQFDLLACACDVDFKKTPILIRCTQNFGSFHHTNH